MANEVVSYGQGAQGAQRTVVSWEALTHDLSIKHVGFIGDCCDLMVIYVMVIVWWLMGIVMG